MKLTTGQIDKMTNEELDAAVAQWVMGYKKVESGCDTHQWHKPEGGMVWDNDFSPSTDANDALLVCDKISNTHGLALECCYAKHRGWGARFAIIDTPIRTKSSDDQKTFMLAACRAALHAAVEMEAKR